MGIEVAHFSIGDTPILEASYFAIPAALALIFFERARERAVAFGMLTAIGLIGTAAAVYLYLAR